MYAPLEGLSKALEIQGGMAGPDTVRDDAGLYLQHDITDYLSRVQTYAFNTQASTTSVGAADSTINTPGVEGLRYGRYLYAACIGAGANITMWTLALANSGLQPGYPSSGANPQPIMAGLARQAITALIPEVLYTRLPLWCPPGSYLIATVRTSAAAGLIVLQTGWLTTEELNQANTAPAGQMRAPIKW